MSFLLSPLDNKPTSTLMKKKFKFNLFLDCLFVKLPIRNCVCGARKRLLSQIFEIGRVFLRWNFLLSVPLHLKAKSIWNYFISKIRIFCSAEKFLISLECHHISTACTMHSGQIESKTNIKFANINLCI